VMRDKAVAEITEILFPVAERVIVTMAQNPRSATSEEIRHAAARTTTDIVDAPSVAAAMTRATDLAGPHGLVLVTGSIYIVGEALQFLAA